MTIAAVPATNKGEYEVIVGEIDSGAVHTVGPPTIANAFPLQQTIASKSGENYIVANGTDIENYGQRIIKGLEIPIKISSTLLEYN